ncbi:maturation of 5S rRNA [Blomia tropicalis]|nr:maturation of 5S rRNA [Blomia tropicalis]
MDSIAGRPMVLIDLNRYRRIEIKQAEDRRRSKIVFNDLLTRKSTNIVRFVTVQNKVILVWRSMSPFVGLGYLFFSYFIQGVGSLKPESKPWYIHIDRFFMTDFWNTIVIVEHVLYERDCVAIVTINISESYCTMEGDKQKLQTDGDNNIEIDKLEDHDGVDNKKEEGTISDKGKDVQRKTKKRVKSKKSSRNSKKFKPHFYDEDDILSNPIEGDNSKNTVSPIDWPKELVTYTKTLPSIQFSINPNSVNENEKKINCDNIPVKYENGSICKENSFEPRKKTASFIGKMKGPNKNNKLNTLWKQSELPKFNMNSDYNYYYQYYYANGYPNMSANDQHSSAAFSAYYQMMNSYDYTSQQVSEWVNNRGFNLLETNKYEDLATAYGESKLDKTNQQLNNVHTQPIEQNDQGQTIKTENVNNDCVTRLSMDNDLKSIEVITTNNTSSSVSSDFVKFDLNTRLYNGNDDHQMENKQHESLPPSPPPFRPKMTYLEATETITLPNGVTLPPGTKQIIVHPYNRPVY